jgi:cytidylate kinase
VPADDAIVLDTTQLGIEAVFDAVMRLVRERGFES